MSFECNCPEPTSLTPIETENCRVDLKQVQRYAFQRDGYQFNASGTTPNPIVDLSSWQAFTTASDDSTIVITPLIGADPVIEAGDKITTGGGDNSTLNGVEELEGVNPSNASAVFKSLSAKVEAQIKKLMCEKNLTVYLFLQGGKIAAVKLSADAAKGFACQSVFLSDRNNAGYGTRDTFNFSFALPAGWSENLEIYTPNFNPLTQL